MGLVEVLDDLLRFVVHAIRTTQLTRAEPSRRRRVWPRVRTQPHGGAGHVGTTRRNRHRGLLVGAVARPRRGSAAPTKPGNFRVTAKTQTTVSVAWNRATDDSGSLTYAVRMWQDGRYVTVATLPQTQTAYTKTGLVPNVTYYFHVEAVDPSGNRSLSDGAYTTTLADRAAPAAPAGLRVTRVTAAQIDLAWDAVSDDTGIRAYLVAVSPQVGQPVVHRPDVGLDRRPRAHDDVHVHGEGAGPRLQRSRPRRRPCPPPRRRAPM